MKNNWRNYLLGETYEVNVGDVVEVIRPPPNSNVKEGDLAICVDGVSEFLDLWRDLVFRVGLSGAEEFIWVKWLDESHLNGAYAKYRFKVLSFKDKKFN